MKRDISIFVSKPLGEKIREARTDQRIKQTQIAKDYNLPNTVTLCRIEKGKVLASDKMLSIIARALGKDENFFINERDKMIREMKDEAARLGFKTIKQPWYNVDETGQTLPKDKLIEIYHTNPDSFNIQLLREEVKNKTLEYKQLEQQIGIEPGDFNELRRRIRSLPPLADAPAIWAERTRDHFQIDRNVPIADFVQILERTGIRIIFSEQLRTEASKSFYDNTTRQPIIVLNRTCSSERLLNYVAKEIAQICVWCNNGYKTLASRELNDKAAQRFAAELLVPRSSIIGLAKQLNISRDIWTLELICEMKIRYGVSAWVFLYRLSELDLISPAVFNAIKVRLGEEYGFTEPDPSVPPYLFQNERWLNILRARASIAQH